MSEFTFQIASIGGRQRTPFDRQFSCQVLATWMFMETHHIVESNSENPGIEFTVVA